MNTPTPATPDTMIRDAGDYAGMLFVIYMTQGQGAFCGGSQFLPCRVFGSIPEAQAYCEETAKLMQPGITLQPAKEHNGRLVGSPVRGSAVIS